MSGKRDLAAIIPSKTRSNVVACLRALRQLDPAVWRVVIDDGIEPSLSQEPADGLYEISLPGVKPFVFARNCNLGIATTGADDVVLLNDDAMLRTEGGFTAMQNAARLNPDFGIISATTNLAGNPDQQPHGVGLRDAGEKSVAFVCVLIPRRTIERVGLLDERFTAYGWEDNDYCRRVREAGLKVGIFDGCFVDHASLQSTFRGDPRAAADIQAGARIYQQKWGNLA